MNEMIEKEEVYLIFQKPKSLYSSMYTLLYIRKMYTNINISVILNKIRIKLRS